MTNTALYKAKVAVNNLYGHPV